MSRALAHRWNFLFGGCLAAGGRAGLFGPRPQSCLALATDEAGSPRAWGRRGATPASSLTRREGLRGERPPLLWVISAPRGWSGPWQGRTRVLETSLSLVSAETRFSLPGQKALGIFRSGVISGQSFVHTERGAEGMLAGEKVAVWPAARQPVPYAFCKTLKREAEAREVS